MKLEKVTGTIPPMSNDSVFGLLAMKATAAKTPERAVQLVRQIPGLEPRIVGNQVLVYTLLTREGKLLSEPQHIATIS
jgi:hypothetical protein